MKKLRNVMLALALLLVAVTPALAVEDVPTGGVVSSCDAPPFIKAKWEGPDMDPLRDCVQIIPNLGIPTTIKVCAIVTDPNGPEDVTAVTFEVIEPSDHCVYPPTEYKLEGTMRHVGATRAMIQKAFDEGWLVIDKDSSLDDIMWEMFECDPPKAWLWCGTFEYENHQPAGIYKVKVYAFDKCSGVDTLENEKLEIASVVGLDIDFGAGLDWGNIKPSVRQWICGDDDMETTPEKPTVWNSGNNPARLWLHMYPLVGQDGVWVPPDTIDDFDVELNACGVAPVDACQPIWIPGILKPCTPTPLSFSVHAEFGTKPDTYKGTLDLTIDHLDGQGMYCK